MVRRAVFALGTLCVLGGIGLLGAGAYLFAIEDDETTANDNAALVDLTDDAIDLGIERLAFPPEEPEPSPAAPATPPLRDSDYQLVIEKLGISAPVSTFGLGDDLVPDVPYTSTDVAWYDFSARPGTGGNAVFAGHVTWNGRAVFYNLDQLQGGDRIQLQQDGGAQLVYQVSSVFQVDPRDPDSLKVMWATENDVITIITCSGKFYTTDDPIAGGDYTHRLVVRAELVAVNPAAAGG